MESEEFVDKSEWLPLKIVKQYADYAVNNGRKVFNNGSIIPHPKSKPCIDRLCEDEQILKPEHQSAAEAFKALVDCAEGKLVAATHKEPIETAWLSPALKVAAIYQQLCKRDAYYVDRVIFGTTREPDYAWMRKCQQTLNDAFDSLCDAMRKDNILDAVEVIRKKEIDKNVILARIAGNSRAISVTRNNPPIDEIYA